jgi:uncharacterized RDD family membrane protein YckC
MQPNRIYATFWQRFFATFLDSLIWSVDVVLVVFLLCTVFASTASTLITALSWFGVYLVLVHGIFKLLVQPYLISTFGGSIGKQMFGQEVIHQDGSKLTYNRAFFREYIAKAASNLVLGLGYYWIYKNPENQAWHDSMSDTYVIQKEDKSPALGYALIAGLIVVEAVIVVVAMFSLSGKTRLFNDFSRMEPEYKTQPYPSSTTVPGVSPLSPTVSPFRPTKPSPTLY